MKANDILIAHDFGGGLYYFVQVVRATEKTVSVRRILSDRGKGTPRPNEFRDDERPKTCRMNDGRIRLSDYTSAKVWDGKPLNNEHPLWGKNYNLY